MRKKILLDTSFLICMGDKTREHHNKAIELFKHFTSQNMRILISTIVLSEYAIAHDVEKLLNLYKFEIVVFSAAHAMKSKDVNFVKYKGTGTTPRNCLKDDFKIIAQCIIEKNIRYFVCEDKPLHTLLETKRQELGLSSSFKPIYVPNGIGAYFSVSKQQSMFPPPENNT